jgi:predicted Zn-dependent protease
VNRPIPRLLLVAATVNATFLFGCAGLDRAVNGPVHNNQAEASPTDAAASPTSTEVASASPDATPDASAEPTGTPNKGRFFGLVGSGSTSAFQTIRDTKDATLRPLHDAIDNISPEDERAEGQAASFKLISQEGGLILDKPLVQYVNQVANLVAQYGERIPSPRTGKPRTKARRFIVGVLDSDEINAFSLPGGYIYITRGLLQNLSCESDLAWVLGHEIAHVDQEHGLTALKGEVGAIAAWRGTVGGKPGNAADADNPTFGSEKFFGAVAGKLTEIVLRGHSNEEENVADALGLEMAIKAGYDAHGAERVLNMMLSAGSGGGKGHLDPQTRLHNLQDAIDAAKAGGMIGLKRFDLNAAQRLEVAMALPDHEKGTK